MRYYYPNRPVLVPPDPKNPLEPCSDYIDSLERSERYVAEQKWNGDNVLIYTDEYVFWNRRKELHRYNPPDEVMEELELWPRNCILNAELVHYKTKTIKDLIIVHCIMAWEGSYLIGKRWGDSRELLDQAVDNGLSGVHIQVSKLWKTGFWDLFQAADGEIIEGIILKDPKGKLQFSATPLQDVSWMMKIRKPCKKYRF